MTTETVAVTDHTPIPWSRLLNPIWMLASTGDATLSFKAPAINNYEPYLPGIKNQLLRNIMWWFRNPAGNFVGFIVGLDGVNYSVTGSAPALASTGRDCGQEGWRWAILKTKWMIFPFVSYYKNGFIEFYLGWRPASGGLGIKLVHGKPPMVIPQ